MIWNESASRTRGKYRKMMPAVLAAVALATMRGAAAVPAAPATGTTTKVDLQSLAEEKRYLDLEAALNGGAGDPTSQSLYRGVLADSENNLGRCIRLLTSLTDPTQGVKLSGQQEIICLKALADAYFKSFRYNDDASTLTMLLNDDALPLTAAQRKDSQDDLEVAQSLAGDPAQTTDLGGYCKVATSVNAIGLTVVPVTADGIPGSWVVDTGANLSTISRSTADRLGLTLSATTVPVEGADGGVVMAHTAVIPQLTIGSATIQNTPVLVMEDSDLYMSAANVQLSAIIGYPALSSLDNITFFRAGGIAIDSSLPENADPGARMFLDGYSPVIAITDGSGFRLCTFDSGAPATVLYDTYEKSHASLYANENTSVIPIGGVGGTENVTAYLPSSTTLVFGSTPLTLGRIAVLTQPRTADPELFYGNIGHDIIPIATSVTIDFQSMRFRVTTN